MAAVAAAGQSMEEFVRCLFHGSPPDLSTLTHAIVRQKYLAHTGKEALTKEEKGKLKRLIEKELLQIQIEDSGDKELLTKLQPSVESGHQKRTLYVSSSSGDEVAIKQERKKRRTVKELELSSDEEDSGIDSKKAQVCCGPKRPGKSSSSSDHGDSGGEGLLDTSGSEKQNVKITAAPLDSPSSKRQQNQGKRQRSGSESEDSKSGLESDVEEKVGKTRKATRGQTGELEDSSEQDFKDGRLQKKKRMGRDQKGPTRAEEGDCRKNNAQRRTRGTDSEEESELPETCGKGRTNWSDSEEEGVGDKSRKAAVAGGPRVQKAQEPSQSEDDADRASWEKQKTRRKASSYKQRKKDVSAEESESDSDETEGDGPMKKSIRRAKSKRADAEKQKSDSDSEEKEVLKKMVKKQGVKKAQGRGTSGNEREESQKRKNPVKQRGGLKPKRKMSRNESRSKAKAEKGSVQNKKETWRSSSNENESHSEEDQRGKGKKQSEKKVTSGDDSESSTEETAGVNRRRKRTSGERKENKEGFGSGSSQEEEEERKKKGAEKSPHKSVSEAESESGSEDSGSDSLGKEKNRSRPEKVTQKPKGRSNSQEELSESDKEEAHSASGEEDDPPPSKQQHRGKDKKHHSAKGEDHPSIQRLKRYIRECGARRNYKKLFMGCRSRKAQLEVLKQELENLGLKGTPTLAKCKALKKKLEEAAEVASLDLSNIITTEGRPKRRNAWSLYSKPEEPTRSPDESPIRHPVTDWSRLRGVISSDDESD